MNNSNLKKSPKAGRVMGIVLLIIGGLLTGILIFTVLTADSFPKILIAGPSIFGVGIGMFVFPGGNFTFKEMNQEGGKKGARRLWSDAPTLHKLAWIFAGAIGLAISFKLLVGTGFLRGL